MRYSNLHINTSVKKVTMEGELAIENLKLPTVRQRPNLPVRLFIQASAKVPQPDELLQMVR